MWHLNQHFRIETGSNSKIKEQNHYLHVDLKGAKLCLFTQPSANGSSFRAKHSNFVYICTGEHIDPQTHTENFLRK